MFKNFLIVVIEAESHDQKLKDIHDNPDVQLLKHLPVDDIEPINETWYKQYRRFMKREQKEFDVAYKPTQHECFLIKGFPLPVWIKGLDNTSVNDMAETRLNIKFDNVRGIVGLAQTERNEFLLLFQTFYPSQSIKANNALIKLDNYYKRLPSDTCLKFTNDLSAIYLYNDETFLFNSVFNVNRFLSMHKYYEEASDDDIRKILTHDKIKCDNKELVIDKINDRIRNSFSELKYSTILSDASINDILTAGAHWNIEVNSSDGKFIFPTEQRNIINILKLLNGRIFETPILKIRKETNSSRDFEL